MKERKKEGHQHNDEHTRPGRKRRKIGANSAATVASA
jgi:hypothetical protein